MLYVYADSFGEDSVGEHNGLPGCAYHCRPAQVTPDCLCNRCGALLIQHPLYGDSYCLDCLERGSNTPSPHATLISSETSLDCPF